ncbi:MULTISPECIES: dTDP-4-dehydrorhamnose 3,5-epimerase [Modicisalibacter]|uniref:dTDP-4-dehydrorhamnose 3,5-epimerase n=1 Tax=Modicisalibacter tunisiensis TaxID=390637 RepID=A0ABS7WVP4_9GAMM|nr:MULTISPECIES: dTDP-4-dehydrorhamnose 3,5-epimerase [Modicisalibacter]MBZ9566667.1 dTDP-4-dehydrorhamnose 3,5-epimerase [Modicisalibacter tunisiensis]
MGLSIETLAIPEVKIITPARHGDERGFFSESWSRPRWHEAGITLDFVQDNHAYSAQAGTLRGLHFQVPPFAQAKLVRVVRGAILDVAVDLRQGSPTFGQHVSAEISARQGNQILIPEGFAHGLLTLEPDTEVLYKVTQVYSPAHDKGLRWNDPDLAIDWPITRPVLSEKDRQQPWLRDLPRYFELPTSEAP